MPLTPPPKAQDPQPRSRRELRALDAAVAAPPVVPEPVSRRSRRQTPSFPVHFPQPEVASESVLEPVPVDAVVPVPAPVPAPVVPVPVPQVSRRQRRALEAPVAPSTPELDEVLESEIEPLVVAAAPAAPAAPAPPAPPEPEADAVELAAEIADAGHTDVEVLAEVLADLEVVTSIVPAPAPVVLEQSRRPRTAPKAVAVRAKPTLLTLPRVLRRPRALSPERARSLKSTIMSGFVMVVSLGMVASLSLPALGSATVNDFAAVQTFSDAGSSQNLPVTGGTALVASRDDYYAQGAPGSLYSTTNTSVSKQAQALAVELMAAVAAGKLHGSTPDHIKEIQWIANGVAESGCGVDLRILQVLVVAVRTFNTVGVSDINRRCTGQIEGAGLTSTHYANGGGHAVDFYELNGQGLDGADANTITLARALDPLMPKGSNLGQESCRTYQGIHLNLVNMTEFDDSCTHMHVDVGTATGGLAGNIT